MNNIKKWTMEYVITFVKVVGISIVLLVAGAALLSITACILWSILNVFGWAREIPGVFNVIANSVSIIAFLVFIEIIRRLLDN